jgi:hypothetical protein
MDQVRIRESAEQRKIVWLADYRRGDSPDNERPPPSPRPAAARQPAPPSSIDALGSADFLKAKRRNDSLAHVASGISNFRCWPIVLQNYFRDQNAQH